ncbi:unnamed protein product [Brassica oleracea var. botrytis]
MFQMSCNENTDCEILSAMNCESCLKSDAVTYCPLHNKLLCYYCDIKIHLPEPVPPLLELEIEVKATKKTDRRKFTQKKMTKYTTGTSKNLQQSIKSQKNEVELRR